MYTVILDISIRYIYIYLDLCCHQDDAQAPAADDTKPKDDEAWVDCYIISSSNFYLECTHTYTRSQTIYHPREAL